MAELRTKFAQAIRDSNNTPEARSFWERNPHLIPASLYADAAANVVEPVLYGWQRRAQDAEAAHVRLWWVADDAIDALLRTAAAIGSPGGDGLRTRALRLRDRLGPKPGDRP